jgi:hypothetical protein
MLEIHRRYVLDNDDFGVADEVLWQAVLVRLEAVDKGEYDDCDKAGLEALFDRVKQNGQSRCEIQA